MAKIHLMMQARLQREQGYFDEEDDCIQAASPFKDPVEELLQAHSPLRKTKASAPVTNLLLPLPSSPHPDPKGPLAGPCAAIREAMRKSSGPMCQNAAWIAVAQLDAREQRLHARQKRQREELDAQHALEQARIDEARAALIPSERNYDTIVIHCGPVMRLTDGKLDASKFSYTAPATATNGSSVQVWFPPGLHVSRGPIAMKVGADTQTFSVEFTVRGHGHMMCNNVLHVRQRFYMFMVQHGQAKEHGNVATFFDL